VFATQSSGSVFVTVFVILTIIGVLAVVGVVAFVLAIRTPGPQLAERRRAPGRMVAISALVLAGIVFVAAVVAFVVALGQGPRWTF
jgi:hypothetical protein